MEVVLWCSSRSNKQPCDSYMHRQIMYTLQYCIFILLVTDTSWTIMLLYIEPEVLKNSFAEHQSDFQHLSWPPHSPDFNSIENVWNMMERRIRKHSPLPSNSQDQKSCIVNGCKYTLRACRLDVQANQNSYPCKR